MLERVVTKLVRPEYEGQVRFMLSVLHQRQPSRIGSVLDCYRADGALAVTRSFVPGQSLAERLQEGPVSRSELLWIGRQLLLALHQLHSHGVLHCNLKPSNVILQPDQALVLVDLGRWARSLPHPYLAPEARGLLGGALTEASDLYSAGLILLELATGGLDPGRLPDGDPLQLILPAILHPDPGQRLADAAVAERVLEQQGERDLRNSGPITIPQYSRLPMIGRVSQLQQLKGAWHQPEPGVLVLRGQLGTGKTRLLEELVFQIKPRRLWRSDCRPQTAAALGILEPLGLGGVVDPGGPEEFRAVRVLESVIQRLRKLSRSEGPILWICEDVQWADPLSLKLLQQLARARLPQLLVVATLDTDQVLADLTCVRLDVLSWEQVGALIKSLVGPPADELTELVFRSSNGNPWWALQAVRSLEREGLLYRHQRRWRQRDHAPDMTGPEWLRLRLKRLPPDLKRALARFSVLGSVFTWEQAEVVYPEPDLWTQLAAARRAHLLQEESTRERYRFAHHSVTEACRDLLDPLERQALHRRVAGLEPENTTRLYHLCEAGEHAEACALLAAREALAAGDWEGAAGYYSRARHSDEELADVLSYGADYSQAEATYRAALQAHTAPPERGRLHAKLAELRLRLGDSTGASEHFAAAAKLLPEGDSLLRALTRLAESRLLTEGSPPLLQAADMARRQPELPTSAWALASRAVALAHSAPLKDTQRAVREALLALKRCPDRWIRATASFRLGYVCFCLGQLSRSRRLLRRAQREFQGTGDLLRRTLTQSWLSQISQLQGQPGDSAPLRASLEDCREAGLPIAEAYARYTLALQGALPESALEKSWDTAAPLLRVSNELAQAVSSLQRGRLRQAKRLLERLQGISDPVRAADIKVWRATALRKTLQGAPPGVRRAVWRQAWRAAREALAAASTIRPRLPHALREMGLLAAEAGRPERARRYLELSLQHAEHMGANLEVARSLAELGRLGVLLSWPNASSTLEAGLKGLADCQAPDLPEHETRANQDDYLGRFADLLEWGTRLTRLLDEDLVLETARQGLAQLLQGESCRILPAGQESPVDSLLTCPVVCQEGPSYTLCVQHPLPHGRYGEEEKKLAACLAALTEVAIRNARTFATRLHNYNSLQVSHARFRALLDGAGAGIAMVDEEDRIREHNAELLRILELESAVGRRFVELLEPAYQPAEQSRFDAGVGSYSVEVPFCSPGPAWARLSLLRLAPSGLTVRSVSPCNPSRLQEILNAQVHERSTWAAQLKAQVEAPLERLLAQLTDQPLARAMASRLYQELRDTRRGLTSRRRLPQLLESLLAMTRSDNRLRLDWNIPMEEVDDLTASCLERCLLELVSNACRHGQAEQISVRVERRGPYLRAQVNDDGVGFGEDQVGSSRRHGLKGIRFRIELLGGQFQLQSEKGHGTRVRFSLPL